MSAIAVGPVGVVVVDEEPLPHLGWWRVFEQTEKEEGRVSEQARLTTEELAEIGEHLGNAKAGCPAGEDFHLWHMSAVPAYIKDVGILLAEVERLQEMEQRLREALEAEQRFWAAVEQCKLCEPDIGQYCEDEHQDEFDYVERLKRKALADKEAE